MKKLLYFLVFICFSFTNLAVAQNIVIKQNIPQAKMVGSYCRDDAPVGVLLGGVGDDANAA